MSTAPWIDENCKEFEFQTDWNHYIDLRQTFLALKLKNFMGFGHETYNTRDDEKQHKKAKVEEETEEKKPPVPHVIHVNKILQSFFSNVEMYFNKKVHVKWTLCAQVLQFQKLQWSHPSKKANFSLRRVRLRIIFRWNYENAFVLTFSTRMKMLGRHDGHKLCGYLGVDFFPLLNCYFEIWM